jgi:ribokinase
VSGVVVLGYVNLEHVVGLNRDVEAGVTSLVTARHTPAGGRLGGCASYIATGLAEQGVEVAVASFVGEDESADVVERLLASAGVGVDGLERGPQLRTGIAWLPYAPSAKSYCIFDPGGELPGRLSPGQERLCREASWLVAAVGAPGPCEDALAALPPSASLCWAVKADPTSFPPALARRLAARAEIVLFSEGEEADFLTKSLGSGWRERTDALVVETRGTRGVRYWVDGAEESVTLQASLDVLDTIGAGDRFCVGLLAATIGANASAADAIAAGIESAAALLRTRLGRDVLSISEEGVR